ELSLVKQMSTNLEILQALRDEQRRDSFKSLTTELDTNDAVNPQTLEQSTNISEVINAAEEILSRDSSLDVPSQETEQIKVLEIEQPQPYLEDMDVEEMDIDDTRDEE